MLLGVIEAVDQAGRDDIKPLGGNGMKQVIEMGWKKTSDAHFHTYLPSMIKSAIYMTVGQFNGQAPMRGLSAGCAADHAGERRAVLLPRFSFLTPTQDTRLRPGVRPFTSPWES